MRRKKYSYNIFLSIVPAALLLLSLLPMPFPLLYGALLQIGVSLAAAYIAYRVFREKPPYYLLAGITFILIVLIYNPFIKLTITMGVNIPLNLITGLIFLAHGFFVLTLKE